MTDIKSQIDKSRACAKRVRDSKFPDYHAAKWLERNADSLEKLLAVYEAAQAIGGAAMTKALSNALAAVEAQDQSNQKNDGGT